MSIHLGRQKLLQKSNKNFSFSHPDYTVGTGITPVQAFASRTITAGEELRLAPKEYLFYIFYYGVLDGN